MTGTTTTLPRFAGKLITLGDRELVLPAMSLAVRKQDSNARQAILSGATELDEEAVVTNVILATLQRNYPDLTLEALQDLASFEELMEAYATLKEEEARRMEDLGKRVAAGPLASPVAT